MNLILATKSPYKRQQLMQLGLDFDAISADIDENHAKNPDLKQLSIELAEEKALAVFNQYPNSIVIGSDQTAADPRGNILTKPGSVQKAIDQLSECSGKTIHFYSGVSLQSPTQKISWTVTTQVQFRTLSLAEIERYIQKDSPLDCAGSFKAESLGIALFERIESEDPSALIGLPLISLGKELRALGLMVP